MLELKFAIYDRAARLSSCTGFPSRCMQYWVKNHWPDQALFKHSLHTNCIS